MSKLMRSIDAVTSIKDGDTIAIGGFGPRGYPGQLVKALYLRSEAKNLHIAINATNGMFLPTLEKLLKQRGRSLTTTFVRSSTVASQFYDEKRLRLIPQGTFAESLRAAGMGIPAFYTPVGIGTIVAEGKETKEFDGKEYILEHSLPVDVAFIQASIVDYDGNCYIKGCQKNFSALMPLAAKYTVVEAEKIVPVGEIHPELVTVPGIYIDGIVKVGVKNEQ